MINCSSIKTKDIKVQVEGLTNYINQANFTIKTLKYIQKSIKSALNSAKVNQTRAYENVRSASI